MRAIPTALQTKLDEGATTLAHAWIVRRSDGVVLGFTDHDRDLAVAGVPCRAASGFDATAAAEKLGFAVAHAEVAGALVDEAISVADVESGRYDGASVEIRLVDWTDPSLSVLLRVMTVGEITRADDHFRAELRSVLHRLDETRGRLFTPRCSADLGDARCGVDLSTPQRRGTASVVAVEGDQVVTVGGLSAMTPGILVSGKLVWTSGANQGLAVEIAGQGAAGAATRLWLWQPMPNPIAVGDQAQASAGCDKTWATCRNLFANGANFRGFPHMPGNDRLFSVPVTGDAGNDGRAVGGGSGA